MKTLCCLDDVLMHSRNEEQHLLNLNAVLTRLKEAALKLHADKWEFLKPSIKLIGHWTDHQVLYPVESIEAIVKALHLKNIDELFSIINLDTYYQKFLPNVATFNSIIWSFEEQHNLELRNTVERCSWKSKEILQSLSLLLHFSNIKACFSMYLEQFYLMRLKMEIDQ